MHPGVALRTEHNTTSTRATAFTARLRGPPAAQAEGPRQLATAGGRAVAARPHPSTGTPLRMAPRCVALRPGHCMGSQTQAAAPETSGIGCAPASIARAGGWGWHASALPEAASRVIICCYIFSRWHCAASRTASDCKRCMAAPMRGVPAPMATAELGPWRGTCKPLLLVQVQSWAHDVAQVGHYRSLASADDISGAVWATGGDAALCSIQCTAPAATVSHWPRPPPHAAAIVRV